MINDQALAEVRSRVLQDILAAGDRQASILLLGRGGKTALLKEVARKKNAFYLDLRKVHTPPELFSLQIAGLACSWSLKLDDKKLDEAFLRKHKDSLVPEMRASAEAILSELEKLKPDQKRLVTAAMSMLEELGKKERLTLCLDNTNRLLDLDNFAQVGDIFSLLPRNITYIISSSVDRELKPRLKGFTTIELKPLTKDETRLLVEKITGKKSQSIIDQLFELSKGDARVISAVSERLKTSDVRSAFLKELIWRDGSLYHLCDKLYTEAMTRTRGQSFPNSIMLILSQQELKLSELARKLYRSAPVTKSLLERLVKADLVEKRDKVFCVADPLLKEWLRLQQHWQDNEPTAEQLKEVGQ